MARIQLLVFVSLISSLVAHSQLTMEDLRKSIQTNQYLIAYSDRFLRDDNKYGYYFIIDNGKKDIQSTIDSLIHNVPISDSSSYLKDRKGGMVDFNSPVDFLGIMQLFDWELIEDQSFYPALLPINRQEDTFSLKNRNNKISVFLLRKKEK